MPMVAIKVTFVDARPKPRAYMVDINVDAKVDDALKEEILHVLGSAMGFTLDPTHYKLDWQGSFDEPHFIMRRI